MQNDCEVYVDPEEDEVFFGCVSEKEKFLSAKLAEPRPKHECELNGVSEECNSLNCNEKNVDNKRNEGSNKVIEEILIDDSLDSIQPLTDAKESCNILSNNTSVELEHNYSTPMKQKIDKSILATPKSVVKADRDGGFLKVLSEIALVKAEAEGNQKSEEEDEEDKENKVRTAIPEIKVIEATPEKGIALSPPRSINTEFRRFRIIYSSPQNEDNIVSKSFEEEKNLKNKCLDGDVEKFLEKEKKKSVDLIQLKDSTNEIFSDDSILPGKGVISTEDNCTENEKHDVNKPLVKLRFSKEAKKVVEVLKKSTTFDDTLNFTIPEIDVEEEENSFLSPVEPVSGFDLTVIPNVKVHEEKTSPRILAKPADNKLAIKAQTVEKDRRKLTPVTSQSKIQTMKFFSERRIYNQMGSEGKSKCAKKLPLEEKRPTTVEKVKGGGLTESNSVLSRIPVFGGAQKNSGAKVLKTTPSKTPSGKSYKNSKFNHIESPINAYIHNKPTSLLLNVKPEMKKDSLTKVWKPQTAGKIEQKDSKQQGLPVRLPYVEYKSATPYKIEKRLESRLPRLAPTVMKLIGNNSPKLLRHEGRYYVNTPRKDGATDNSTIVADPNEVSVVVSHPVQKSNTRKLVP